MSKFWKTKAFYRNVNVSSIVNKEYDVRSYAKVTFLNKTLTGPLDTGASISCIGGSLAEDLARKLYNRPAKVKTADVTAQTVLGYFNPNVEFKNSSNSMKIYLIPTHFGNRFLQNF
jgi:hypothetical protein